MSARSFCVVLSKKTDIAAKILPNEAQRDRTRNNNGRHTQWHTSRSASQISRFNSITYDKSLAERVPLSGALRLSFHKPRAGVCLDHLEAKLSCQPRHPHNRRCRDAMRRFLRRSRTSVLDLALLGRVTPWIPQGLLRGDSL